MIVDIRRDLNAELTSGFAFIFEVSPVPPPRPPRSPKPPRKLPRALNEPLLPRPRKPPLEAMKENRWRYLSPTKCNDLLRRDR